jgi:hypothetical protein
MVQSRCSLHAAVFKVDTGIKMTEASGVGGVSDAEVRHERPSPELVGGHKVVLRYIDNVGNLGMALPHNSHC